ncbi:PREDICTED: solute carrier organic anion transporter family member 1A2 [Sturnus vulgaris]|uniref:solute carrier organic anion transporter family member 1A2 n=1 Tax=Sturnus vulgaris TaxID=9172 RepID=UPI00071A35C3|nr:PREDICTED: solute carrier organic anion transporter family member 1A2 [Sturnus vulgaris]
MSKFKRAVSVMSSRNLFKTTQKQTSVSIKKGDMKEPEKPRAEDKICCISKLKVFLLALSLAFLGKTMSGAYMNSMYTQIEKQFNIPASLVGIINGSFEIGNLLLIAFVSYFGAKLHRPRIIALGCTILSFGCLLISLPHFLFGSYHIESSISQQENFSVVPLCLVNQNLSSLPTEEPSAECEKEPGSLLWIFVMVGNIVRGMGETPIMPLGISYLEDFAKAENSPFYLACLHTSTVIGPFLGLLLASFCAELFVDIGSVSADEITITATDARWVGAWWLGILICALLNLLVGIPFWFLPKSLVKEGEINEPEEASEKSVAPLQENDKIETKQTMYEIAKDFIPFLKALFHNPVYMLFICITVLQFSAFDGMISFMPKYLEQQFGKSASDAIFLIGVYNLPVLCVGYFSGGLFMKKFKINNYQAANIAFWVSLLEYLLYFAAYWTVCDTSPVAGLTVSYQGIEQVSYAENTLQAVCNMDCDCPLKIWDPVCGSNGITYVSPCLAGCKSSRGTGRSVVFENCTCVAASGFSLQNISATLGQCDGHENCDKMLHYFLILSLVCSFIFSLAAMPGYMVLIRSLKPEEKSFGVGIHGLASRVFAGIPSPIYFGALIDTTCLKWGTMTCGGEGACRMYDIVTYRWLYLGLPAVLRGVSYIPSTLVLLILKKKLKSEKPVLINAPIEMQDQEQEAVK